MIDPKSEVGMPSVKCEPKEPKYLEVTEDHLNKLEADARRYQYVKSKTTEEGPYNEWCFCAGCGTTLDEAIDRALKST